MQRRLRALKRSGRQLETSTPLKLLTTDELRWALDLVERGGVLPSGQVRRPEVFRSSPPQKSEALERWRQLCGEPLDHLEAAEELLDRVGEAHGWDSQEAGQAALLLVRLELPDASPWFVGKRAEAVLNLYAELEEHRDEPHHPHVRGAVRRLERLKEMVPLASGPEQESLEENTRGTPRRKHSVGSQSAPSTPPLTGGSAHQTPMRAQEGAKNPGGERYSVARARRNAPAPQALTNSREATRTARNRSSSRLLDLSEVGIFAANMGVTR